MTENAPCKGCNPCLECGEESEETYRRGFREGLKYVTSGRLVGDRDFWHKMADYYMEKSK